MVKQNLNVQQDTYASGLLSGFLEQTRMKQAVQFVNSGNNVLDLACNEGALLKFLPANVQYMGIDLSEKAITRAQAQYPQYVFRVADITNPDADLLDSNKFDVIVMLAFLEHVKSPGDLLKNYANYLNSNGLIVVTTPAPVGRRFHDFGARVGLFSKNAAQEHETFLGYQQLVKIARAANLRLHRYYHFLFGFNQLACFSKVS